MVDQFVKIMKGDEVIEVHPLALADHLRLGWKIYDDQAQAAAEKKAAEEQAEADSKAAVEKSVADAKAVQAKAAEDARTAASKSKPSSSSSSKGKS